MVWVALMMLALIGGSIVMEFVLPSRVKEPLGSAICWGMMFVTMSFLILATAGLAVVLGVNVILPAIRG
jgi:hypothetical protein